MLYWWTLQSGKKMNQISVNQFQFYPKRDDN